MPNHPELDPAAAATALAGDPYFGPLIERIGALELREPMDTHFDSLARAICYQQLAGKAAMTIHGRFVGVCGGTVTPEAVLDAPEEAMRGAGLSRNKLLALRDLAAKVRSGEVPLEGIDALSDDAVVERLVTVRGIGRWSAEMFLIFQLRRPDVWPVGDLGVRNGWGLLHGLAAPPTPKELEPLGDRLRPWRSAAACYRWRAVDTLTPDRKTTAS